MCPLESRWFIGVIMLIMAACDSSIRWAKWKEGWPPGCTSQTLTLTPLREPWHSPEQYGMMSFIHYRWRIPICVFLHVFGFSHLVSCSCTFTMIFFWLDLEIYPSEQWMNQRLLQVQTWQWGLCQEEMMQMVRTVAHFPSFFHHSHVLQNSHMFSLQTFHVCSDSRCLMCLVCRCLTCIQTPDVSCVSIYRNLTCVQSTDI